MEKTSSENNIDLKTVTTPEQLIDLASHGRLKLAQLQTLIVQKLAEKVAEMNTSNNDLWKDVMIGLGGSLLAVGGAYAATREK